MSQRMLEQTPEVNEAASIAIQELDQYYFPTLAEFPGMESLLNVVRSAKLEALYTARTLAEVEAARAIPWDVMP